MPDSGGSYGDLKPASGLENNQRWRQSAQITDELLQRFAIAWNDKRLTRRTHMNIETVLRHIDPNEARRSRVAFHDPSLRMRARLAAQATVRVPYGTDGRGTSLFLGLNHPGGPRSPVHR